MRVEPLLAEEVFFCWVEACFLTVVLLFVLLCVEVFFCADAANAQQKHKVMIISLFIFNDFIDVKLFVPIDLN